MIKHGAHEICNQWIVPMFRVFYCYSRPFKLKAYRQFNLLLPVKGEIPSYTEVSVGNCNFYDWNWNVGILASISQFISTQGRFAVFTSVLLCRLTFFLRLTLYQELNRLMYYFQDLSHWIENLISVRMVLKLWKTDHLNGSCAHSNLLKALCNCIKS